MIGGSKEAPPVSVCKYARSVKLNLGCGKNKLDGWENYDAEVDITKPLPFEHNYAEYIFAEHVVEHVTYEEALSFFRECHRVLKPRGVVRIAVPSIERVFTLAGDSYIEFASRWSKEKTRRGAMDAILHAHGHKAPWTESLLLASIYYVGFNEVRKAAPGNSRHAALLKVEGHGRVISDDFNWIETTVVEGTK